IRIFERRLLPTATFLPNRQMSPLRAIRFLLQFRQTHCDGAPGNATGARHQRYAPSPVGRALRGRPQSPRALIQPRLQLRETLLDLTFAGHKNILGRKWFNCYTYFITDTKAPVPADRASATTVLYGQRTAP